MQDQIDELKKDSAETRKLVGEIHTALIGNPEYEQAGLIHEVKKNTEHRKTSVRRSGFIAGVAAAIGAGIAKLAAWLN